MHKIHHSRNAIANCASSKVGDLVNHLGDDLFLKRSRPTRIVKHTSDANACIEVRIRNTLLLEQLNRKHLPLSFSTLAPRGNCCSRKYTTPHCCSKRKKRSFSPYQQTLAFASHPSIYVVSR